MTTRSLRRLLARYRPLVLGQALLRFGGPRPHRAFWAMLAPPDNPLLVDLEIASCMRPGHDACKDKVVEAIREHAKDAGALVVWFCATRWSAHGRNIERPSLDPRRRRVVIVFESTSAKDTLWLRSFGRGGRWENRLSDGGRFLGLVGDRRQLVELAARRKG